MQMSWALHILCYVVFECHQAEAAPVICLSRCTDEVVVLSENTFRSLFTSLAIVCLMNPVQVRY